MKFRSTILIDGKIIKQFRVAMLTCLFVSFIASGSAFAQKRGIVYGVIMDASTNTTLPGATVFVKGTNIGTTTDIDGKYSLVGISDGLVTIQYSYVGYTDEFFETEITGGEKIKKDVVLIMDMLSLGEVVVSSQVLGQTKAINQQLSSDAIVNVVSEDKIKELPDINAAEAIGRLPGISVQRVGGEGSKVTIRGLQPSFTNITINGVSLASSSSNDRSTDLSMISADMLAGIEVYKSPTPDMDGESIGGTVNFSARKAKNKPMAQIKASNIYNDLRSDFNNYQGSVVLSKRFFNNNLGVIGQLNSEKINRGTDNVSNSWDLGNVSLGDTDPTPSPVTQNNTLEYRSRIGASLNVDYKLKNGGVYYSGFFSRTDRDIQTNKRNARISEKLSSFWLSSSQIQKDVLSHSIIGDHGLRNTKLNWVLSTSSSSSYNPYDVDIEFEQQDAFDLDAIAEMEVVTKDPGEILKLLINDPTKVGLMKGQFTPDSTFERNMTAKADWEIPFSLGNNIGGFIKIGGKYEIVDRKHTQQTFKSDYYYLNEQAREDLGASFGGVDFERTEGSERIAMSNFSKEGYEPDEFMNGQHDFYFPMNSDKIEDIYNLDKHNWNYYAGQAKKDEYDAYERLSAGYVMAKINMFSQLTLISGVRLEYSDNEYGAYKTKGGGSEFESAASAEYRTSKMKYLVVLPHLHLKYKPIQWFDARFVVNKTVGRPNYNRVLPREHLNVNGSPYPSISAGNPYLNPTLSTNYDFSVSLYKGNMGLLSAGLFYKDIKDHMYNRRKIVLRTEALAQQFNYPDKTGWSLSTYDNTDAKALGYEMELQASLKFLPKPFNGIVFNANFAHQETNSLYQSSKDTIIFVPNPNSPIPTQKIDFFEVFREAPMVNMAPNTFNFSLGYDLKGFSFRVSAIYEDKKLASISATDVTQDIYTDESWQWDMSMNYKFFDKYKVYVQLNNITNRVDYNYIYDYEYYQGNKQYGFSIVYGIQINL